MEIFFYLGGGGGGGGGGGVIRRQQGMNMRAPMPPCFFTLHIVTISSTELYSLMEIFLMVFKIEGIVA